MNAFESFLKALFSHQSNAGAARLLLERSGQARGISSADAAQLRGNAMAIMRVVR